MAHLQQNELFITFKDLKRLFIKKKQKYYRLALIAFVFIFLWLVIQQPKYSSEAVFKEVIEKGDQSDFLKAALKNLPFQSSEASVISVMKSKDFLKRVVSELGMQAHVSTQNAIMKRILYIKDNLFSELHWEVPNREVFNFSDVHFEGERPLFLYLHFLNKDTFEVFTEKKQKIAEGKLKQPMKIPGCEFTLYQIPEDISLKKFYSLKIAPWRGVVKQVLSHLSIRSSKTDKNILQLNFTSGNRYLAADFLNTLMSSYQAHLMHENKEITRQQLSYFEKRKKELSTIYEKALEEHVDYLTTNLGEEGFMSLKQEIEILEKPKEDYLTKLYEVELELNRLRPQKAINIQEDKKDLDVLEKNEKNLLTKKESLQRTRTNQNEGPAELLPYEKRYLSLEKRLSDVELKKNEMLALSEPSFHKEEIEKLFQQSQEANLLLECLENKKDFPENITLLHDPKTLVASWAKQVKEEQRKLAVASAEQKEISQKHIEEKLFKLKSFLKDFIEIVHQKQKGIIENEMYKKFSTLEFQGLNPETVQELYVDYNHELDAIQVSIKQMIYLRDQILNPETEISSLSSVLSDEVSQQMIRSASLLSLELRDDMNRSSKEHERLKESLTTQKKFLINHISQMLELQKLRARLIEEKILSLQGSSIDLLRTEKSLIEERLSALKERMSSLPKKWKLENELALKKEICKTMMEAIAQLEESKRISHHLFQVESKPIDRALSPMITRPPRLVVYSALFAFLAMFIAYMVHFFRFIAKAPLVSLESLQFVELHASGSLSPYAASPLKEIKEQDLETLRRLVHFVCLEKKSEKGVCVSLIGNSAVNYSHNVAELLSLRGNKVLLVDCSFQTFVSSHETLGLMQFLNRDIDTVPVHKRKEYDFVPSGGYARHQIELIAKDSFAQMIAEMKDKYDFVLIHSRASGTSVEAYTYQKMADIFVVTATTEEPLKDFNDYAEWQRQKNKQCLTFVLSES